MESLAKVTQYSIPVSNFDNDQVNHSLGTMKDSKSRLQNWMEMVPFCSLIMFIFVVLAPFDQYFFTWRGQVPLADNSGTFVSMFLRDVPSGGASAIQGHASAND